MPTPCKHILKNHIGSPAHEYKSCAKVLPSYWLITLLFTLLLWQYPSAVFWLDDPIMWPFLLSSGWLITFLFTLLLWQYPSDVFWLDDPNMWHFLLSCDWLITLLFTLMLWQYAGAVFWLANNSFVYFVAMTICRCCLLIG